MSVKAGVSVSRIVLEVSQRDVCMSRIIPFVSMVVHRQYVVLKDRPSCSEQDKRQLRRGDQEGLHRDVSHRVSRDWVNELFERPDATALQCLFLSWFRTEFHIFQCIEFFSIQCTRSKLG